MAHPFLMRGTLLLLLLSSSFDVVHAEDERTIRVGIGRARIVKIPQGAQTVVIGNPAIADVNILKANLLMIVTAKSFGSTNVIVLDRTGQQVGESILTVVPSSDKLVVQRGAHRESLSCQPECAPAIDLADDVQYLKGVIDGAKTYESATSARK